MGMQLPEWTRTTFLIATGDGWPEADEDALWALAREWDTVGGAIDTLQQQITTPVRAVRRNDWDGPAAEAFALAERRLGGPQLSGLTSGSREVAGFVYQTGVNVQYMKIIVLEELLLLAAQIAQLIGLAGATFGASLSAIPGLKALGQLMARMAVHRLNIWLMSMAVAEVLQLALDSFAQATQLALRTRRHWDSDLTTNAAITGAVSGVLGPVMDGAAGKLLSPAVAKGMLDRDLAKGLKQITANPAQEYTTSGVTGVITGYGWSGTPWDATAGATEGAVGAYLRRHRGALPHDADLGMPHRQAAGVDVGAAPAGQSVPGPGAGAFRQVGPPAGVGGNGSPAGEFEAAGSVGPVAGHPSGLDPDLPPVRRLRIDAAQAQPGPAHTVVTAGSQPHRVEVYEITPDGGVHRLDGAHAESTVAAFTAASSGAADASRRDAPPDNAPTGTATAPAQPEVPSDDDSSATGLLAAAGQLARIDEQSALATRHPRAGTAGQHRPPNPFRAMTEARSFRSLQEAARFMETEIDRPAARRVAHLDSGFELTVASHTFDDGRFTNIYDLSWNSGDTQAAIHLSPRPTEAVATAQRSVATTTAGFFVLLDKTSGLPPQTSLNLAIDQGRVLSLPVVDREAVICRDGVLSALYVPAEGQVTINGQDRTWAGSRTGRAAQSYAYGNGNIVIERRTDPVTGGARALDEASRRTPAIAAGEGWVDVGFRAVTHGGYRSQAVSPEGGMDIFAHDLVLRCQAGDIDPHASNSLELRRIGPLQADALPDFAVTVGPSLDVADFAAHSINRDPSLDTGPTFTELRKVRMVLFHDPEGRTHLRLFDGRAGSSTFQGATPTEARDLIAADTGFQWGCFLDGGGTAKMWVVENGTLTSYGNRHYLQWPKNDQDPFVWVPDTGRPISSVLTFQHGNADALTRDAVRATRLSFPQGQKFTIPTQHGAGQAAPYRPPTSGNAKDHAPRR